MNEHIQIGKIGVRLLWFDSLGAKCSSSLIETPDIKILVDPGAAGMQGSYPLSSREKERLRRCAMQRIKKAAELADTVFISHYHYDHHTLPNKLTQSIYKDKRIWAKNPNVWINRSQWERSRLFFSRLNKGREIYQEAEELEIKDPLDDLSLALTKDFGDYNERRNEILKKGKEWLRKLVKIWQKGPWVKEYDKITFVDGKKFKIGNTQVRFTQPLFHGIEFDRVGWVISLIIEYEKKKVIYTSDLQGPQIEDYAEWIIRENPDFLILDGPPTYLFGYLVNRTNLNRVTENMLRILKETKTHPIIYDHHLFRDGRGKKLLAPIYEVGKDRVISCAELMGRPPLIAEIVSS